jgi:hypothetical protein
VEGSGRGLIKVLTRHLPGGTEENLRSVNRSTMTFGRIDVITV